MEDFKSGEKTFYLNLNIIKPISFFYY